MRVSKKARLALMLTSLTSLVCVGPSFAGAREDYNNGSEYFQMGRLNEAIRWFDKSIAYHEKGFAEPYVNKGFCLQKLGYHDKAILCYNEAIKINPKVAIAYQNRGTAYLHLNRYAESLRDLNQAISIPRPSSLSLVTVYIDRGRAYAGLHKWKESFADFDYVMSMQSADPKMEKLKLAAADEKRKAQALMAQVGTSPAKPTATQKHSSHPTVTQAPTSSSPTSSSTHESSNSTSPSATSSSATSSSAGSSSSTPSSSATHQHLPILLRQRQTRVQHHPRLPMETGLHRLHLQRNNVWTERILTSFYGAAPYTMAAEEFHSLAMSRFQTTKLYEWQKKYKSVDRSK